MIRYETHQTVFHSENYIFLFEQLATCSMFYFVTTPICNVLVGCLVLLVQDVHCELVCFEQSG